MRGILLTLLIVIAALLILWIFAGRLISVVVDPVWTIQSPPLPIHSIAYEGTGTGGIVQFDSNHLSLAPADPSADPPHIGSTKNDQLALAHAGKVFAFGASHSTEKQTLVADIEPGDVALFTIRRSAIAWLHAATLLKDPRVWRRYEYETLSWKKGNGAKLELVWRSEQFYERNKGWTTGATTQGGATGLIRVDISDATQ